MKFDIGCKVINTKKNCPHLLFKIIYLKVYKLGRYLTFIVLLLYLVGT